MNAASPRRRRLLLRVLVVAAAALALCPSVALAHAQLLSTSPADNALVAHQPRVISFTFGESVWIDGDAVRVFDRNGRRVDSGRTFHPGGRGPTVGVRLRPNLPRGTYTATYRVVSADTHIVTGGFVFSIGARSPSGAPALGRLLASQRSGPVTNTAFAAARGVQYAAIGIAAGLLVFLLFVWSPALQHAGLGPERWRDSSARYLGRARAILAAAAGAGALSALAGIVLQGAQARGIDFWHAIDTATVNDVLPTRFGLVWGAGFVAWLAVLFALTATLGRLSVSGPARADPAAGTRVLVAALARFSPTALACVALLIATGVVQAIIEVGAWSQFIDTGYGRAIIVKCAAMVVLIALGARQRRRTIPAVAARAQAGAAPVTAGRLLFQTLGAELVVLAVVLGAVGSLAGSAPAREHGAANAMSSMSGMVAMPGMTMPGTRGGPARTMTTLGAARLGVSVLPSTVGVNQIALTLTDRRTGRPFTATKQLTVTATLRRRNIGPLTLRVRRTPPVAMRPRARCSARPVPGR